MFVDPPGVQGKMRSTHLRQPLVGCGRIHERPDVPECALWHGSTQRFVERAGRRLVHLVEDEVHFGGDSLASGKAGPFGGWPEVEVPGDCSLGVGRVQTRMVQGRHVRRSRRIRELGVPFGLRATRERGAQKSRENGPNRVRYDKTRHGIRS